MEFKRLDKRKGSGAASIRSRYAYLIHLPDIDYFPATNEKGVRLEGDIVLKDGRTMIPVYLTNPSQEYSYDTQGADDEKTFRVKFTGTHPGTELEALEFSKNLIEESFLVLIPSCDKNTPGKLLGQIENPMIFTSTHKAAKDGDKFTFSFEQRIGSEFIYFSYGGIISLPPGGDDPDIPVPPSPGFDPTKWARRDASNIDGDNVLLWREALRIVGDSASLSTKAETDASNIDDHLHIWRQKIDSNYVHDQAQPSSIWTINHPLNKKVSVTITDTAGTVVEGRVTINDGNKVVIEFNFPFSGEAILN